MKTLAALLLLGFCCGCTKPKLQPIPAPIVEPGYHHLMKSLNERHPLHSCEQLQKDGVTCYTINGVDVCGRTRDEAAEEAGAWIDKNIPLTTTLIIRHNSE